MKFTTNNLQPTTNSGQSLFEVVFAVGIMAIILVGVVSLAAKSVKNSTLSGANASATKYAQGAVEWLRGQRDSNWTNLTSHTVGSYYCLVTNPISWGASSGSCPITGDTTFTRRARLTQVNSNTIDAAVEVSWTDSSGLHTVRSVTRFTNWNK